MNITELKEKLAKEDDKAAAEKAAL